MGYTANDVIAIAKTQVGYLEKRSNADLDSMTSNAGYNNYTKYARDFDNKWPNFYNTKKQGAEWCDMFYDWCHVTAAGGDWELARKVLCQPEKSAGAGCYYSAQYYKQVYRFGQTPTLGAQIFFRNYAHTGLVYAYTDTTVYTIEGNTSGASGVVSNGGGCAMKSYPRKSSDIDGYGYPLYSEQSSGSTTEAATGSDYNATVKEDKKLSYFKPAKVYHNGSTPEPVYKDTDRKTKTGELNPWEYCWCMGRYGSSWLVLYKLDGTDDDWAVGYVEYNGEIED
ncbi:MAG: hypothetical protein IJ206_09055 [Oscillospiraceae bacterium]|nr:hypothetical protein [Oscillospiraceae bacterium]